ncbi:MAG: glycosyltransferase [Verrucomicrobiales bacterium]
MAENAPPIPRIVILTGAYDDQYLRTRTDDPAICISAGKRVMLYRAFAEATGAELILVSPQPKGRGRPHALPAVESRFDRFAQRFSRSSGIRKIRYFADFWHYARHVARHVRDGDVLIFDNYELIYILALRYCRLLGRKNRVVLEYEDGKHLIDKGFYLMISRLAEWLGRPLVQAAILATPTLAERLPLGTPTTSVPGILRDDLVFHPLPRQGEPVLFLYSGSIDYERGGPLLLEYLEAGYFPPNAVFHITGQGHFTDRLAVLASKHPGVIHFHGIVSQEELARIRSICHFGLNLQSSANPISRVTYPSKTFDYLNAGIRVISTRAAGVPEVLGEGGIYLAAENLQGLKDAIQNAVNQRESERDQVCQQDALKRLTFRGSITRLQSLFGSLTPHAGG